MTTYDQNILADWLRQQKTAIAEQERREQAEERAEREAEREEAVTSCNNLLTDWGVPLHVELEDEAFPFLFILGHEFRFFERQYVSDYGTMHAHLRHVLRDAEDQPHIDDARIHDAQQLALWLTGEYQQPLPTPRTEEAEQPAAPTVREVYRVNGFTQEDTMQAWLNKQAAEGYEFHSMSAYGTGAEDTLPGVWVIVRRVQV